MPSADKGRYQSRLFNLFHKQSRRFGEGFGRSLRQLQVATNWSIEALSKTVYLLLQKAVDSAHRQLPAAGREPNLQLPSSSEFTLAHDSAIVRVLENVENFSEKIQGVASQLESQNLVLVTSENEILDILTPSQQQALENQIITEIANYWRSWRLSQETQETKLLSFVERLVERLSPGNANKNHALPPGNTTETEQKYLQINPATVASLDTAIAKLETNTLTPVSRAGIIVKQRGGELIKVVRTKLDIFLYGDRNITVSRKQVVIDGADDKLKTHSGKIQTLISAARNYFYGEIPGKTLKQTPRRNYQYPVKSKTPQLESEQSTDNWLTLNDLFNGGLPQLNQENQASNKLEPAKNQLNPSTEVNNSSQKLFRRFQIPNWHTLHLKEKAGLQKPKKAIKQRQQGMNTNNTITPASQLENQNTGEITQTPESKQIETKPEWIETSSEIVGYQKHPLEQILAWIDNTMLKIEEAFIKVAKVLAQLWRK